MIRKQIIAIILLSFLGTQGCSRLMGKETLVSLSPCGTKASFAKVVNPPFTLDKSSINLAQSPANASPNTNDDTFRLQFSTQHPNFFDDKDIMLKAVSTKPEMLRYASPRLKKDRAIVLAAVTSFYPNSLRAKAITYADDRWQQDRDIIMAAVSNEGQALAYVNQRFKKDKGIVMAAITNNISAVSFMHPSLKTDKDIALLALKKNKIIAIRLIDDRLKDTPEIIAFLYPNSRTKPYKQRLIEKINQDPYVYSHLSECMKKDKTIALTTIRNSPSMLLFVPDTLKKDKTIALAAVSRSGHELQNVDDSLQEDPDVVLAAIKNNPKTPIKSHFYHQHDMMQLLLKKNGMALKKVKASFKKNKALVLLAVKNDGEALKYAAIHLRDDQEIVLAAVKTSAYAYEFASQRLRADKTIIMAALIHNRHNGILNYASHALKNDREVVLKAVKIDGNNLRYAATKFQRDREIVLTALQSFGLALKYADNHLKKDKQLALTAVQSDLRAWRYVDHSLRHYVKHSLTKDEQSMLAIVANRTNRHRPIDKNIQRDQEALDAKLRKNRPFVVAMIQRGSSLFFADPQWKKDKQIVLLAVRKNGLALRYADPQLQNDKEVVLAAVKNNGLAYKYVSRSLKNDKQVLLAAVSNDGEALFYYHALHQQRWQTSNPAYVIQQIPLVLPYTTPYAYDGTEFISAISPDGKLIAYAFYEKKGIQIRLFRTRDAHFVKEIHIPTPSSFLSSLFFSPDSHQLLSFDSSSNFIWDFTRNKKPVVCNTYASLLDINTQTNSLLVNPIDDRYGLYDMQHCAPIVIAAGSGVNPPTPPNPVISASNKLLMLAVKPIEKELKEELLYLRPTRVYDAQPLEHYRDKLALWEVPLPLKDKETTTLKVDKKHQRLLTFTPKENGLLLIQWDYNQQKKLSQRLLQGKQGRLAVVAVNMNLQDIYLHDQAGVYVVNYTGEQQKSILYPQNSIAKQWNDQERTSINSCYDKQCLLFFSKDGSKVILHGGESNPMTTEIIRLSDGHLLRRFSLPTKTSGRFFSKSCTYTQGEKCRFSLTKNLSAQGDFLLNKTEVLDTLTGESLVRLTGESFSIAGISEQGETLLLSRSFDERQLTLWKIKKAY